MRYLTMLGLVMFLLAACAVTVAAQDIPPGSYRQTRTDINVINASSALAGLRSRGAGLRVRLRCGGRGGE